MSRRKVEFTLVPVPEKLASSGGYRAQLRKRGIKDYDEVIDEAVERCRIGLDSHLVKMVVSATLDSMINGILEDGIPRRLGDYFRLNLSIKGGFDEPGDQFDPEKHELRLNLTPLKAFKRKPGPDGVAPWNRNAGPAVAVKSVHSVSETKKGAVNFGEDLVIEGENLFALEDGTDMYAVKFYTAHGKPFVATSASLEPAWVSSDGTRLTIPWRMLLGSALESRGYDPKANPPVAVMVGLRTRGGEKTARIQLHRAKAFLKSWIERWPKNPPDAAHFAWGSI